MKSWAWTPWLALSVSVAPAAAQSAVLTETQLLGIDDGAITPDGRLGVLRENGVGVIARVYDMTSGQLVGTHTAQQTAWWTGVAQDAVELTNTRAVVLGNRALILDLTTPTTTLLSDQHVGEGARDVAITPSGDLAIVRGGNSFGAGQPGGSFVFELATGALLASHPGEIGDPNAPDHTYSVDSVVANDDFAVCLSLVPVGAEFRTRVSIWDLRPAAGAPTVVYETAGIFGADQDQLGAPHDVTLTPDGRFAAVRSEFSTSLYDISGAAPTRVWHKRLFGNPGPMGFTSMDSVEAKNDLIATASRWTDGVNFGAQLDLFDLAGNQWYARLTGDPHDLAITPDGTKLFVRTHILLAMFDLTQLPSTQLVQPVDQHFTTSTHTFFGAGYDSIEVTNERVAAVMRSSNTSRVKVFDITGGALALRMFETQPEKFVDMKITPNHNWLVVSGGSRVHVYDLRTFELALAHDTQFESFGLFPWCDGVEVNDERALAWGWWHSQGGWISILSLFPEAQNYCTATPNSSGAAALLSANGSNSILRNDLEVWCTGLPSGANGYMVYATGQGSVPFGGGTLCIAGQRYFMPLQAANGTVAERVFDYTGSTALGGAITAGTTWNFQFRYRDPAAGGAQFNLSDGLSIPFVN
jgi:hypothetical protein